MLRSTLYHLKLNALVSVLKYGATILFRLPGVTAVRRETIIMDKALAEM